ncbi:MAG: monovalent cation/H+ antiporter complex subunit F [Chloroflexota bacterium]
MLILRAPDTLHRVLALDVLVAVLIMLLTILSYQQDVSFYVDAAIGLALLSFTATLVAARHVLRGGRPDDAPRDSRWGGRRFGESVR